MAAPLRRRRALGMLAGALAVPFVPGCGAESACCDGVDATRDDAVFPQGVAAGEPCPDGFVAWTRVASDRPVEPLTFEVARDEDFRAVVVCARVDAHVVADHTAHVQVRGLEPRTHYYYRFATSSAVSRTGRARTAPAPQASEPLRFVVASCQDFAGRSLAVWRWVDAIEAAEGPIDFVLFLGDAIYEYVSGSHPGLVVPRQGRVPVLPDGMWVGRPDGPQVRAAVTLRDYRALYRQVLSDPDAQRVRARYAFVAAWDDHEFANDAWQDHANDFDGLRGDERSTARREAASQAFWEYHPLGGAYRGDRGFPDDIRLYRSLRMGRMLELFVTDQRYYRSDHVIPEGPVDPEVGKFLPNSALGSRVFVRKEAFDAREAAAGVTMLGAAQRAWLAKAVRGSRAAWKFVASPTVMAQMVVDLRDLAGIPPMFRQRFYPKVDQWDGYRSERAAVVAALRDARDSVVLSGDLHGFYASALYEDFDAPAAEPAAVELAVGALSARGLADQFRLTVATNPLLQGMGLEQALDSYDGVLLASSPHLVHAHSVGNGLAVVTVDASACEVRLYQGGDAGPDAEPALPSPVVWHVPRGAARLG